MNHVRKIILLFLLGLSKFYGQTVTLSTQEPKSSFCTNEPIQFNFSGSSVGTGSEYLINMGECSTYTLGYSSIGTGTIAKTIVYFYTVPGSYTVNIYSSNCLPCPTASQVVNIINCNTNDGGTDIGKPECQPDFKLSPGDYMLSFWVREDRSSFAGVSTYVSGLQVNFSSSPPVSYNVYANDPFNALNRIIDGWQKVERKITVPGNASDVSFSFVNNTSPNVAAYFDDVRIHPFNSSFKSYVYDPVTLRLSAELDEHNYATFYEYDEEGQLIRVKKETERGIKTIKESRSSVSK